MKTESEIICKRCVLDYTADGIRFDDNGVCNFCLDFDKIAARTIRRPVEDRIRDLEIELKKIKQKGKGKKYDCILGVSGGVDSTYLALKAKEWNLRPLVVHFDNGWNSELAVKNIENIVSKLGFDLYTYVIDWEQFRDLQLAFIKASVLDLEMPTDQIIFSALYKIASENGIKYVLSGHNIATEAILPPSWYSNKLDYINLKDINQKFGRSSISNLPKLTLYHKYYYQQILCINTVSLLNYIDYNKQNVKNEIIDKLNWQDYGGKHYESIFTKFYQAYILPVKFNIDKRKAHLSNLINSGQMNRDDALIELNLPPFDMSQIESDKEYVAKKLEITVKELEKYLTQPSRSHSLFRTENDEGIRFFYNLFRYFIFFPIRLLRYANILDKPVNPRFY
jgi:N-acetyl sugar amidotransferase